jgi:hypothetical protein
MDRAERGAPGRGLIAPELQGSRKDNPIGGNPGRVLIMVSKLRDI